MSVTRASGLDPQVQPVGGSAGPGLTALEVHGNYSLRTFISISGNETFQRDPSGMSNIPPRYDHIHYVVQRKLRITQDRGHPEKQLMYNSFLLGIFTPGTNAGSPSPPRAFQHGTGPREGQQLQSSPYCELGYDL